MCGHGHFDASSYERFLAGDLEDYELPEERIAHALETIPAI
jgi:tryptophan synthase beta chain